MSALSDFSLESPPTSRRERRWIALAWLAAIAILLFPVFAVEFPPLTDLPNHVARMYVLANLDTNPLLQKYYATDWRPLQFQAIDVFMLPLTQIFGLTLGAKIFVAASLLMPLAGVVALHRALFGRFSIWPLAATLFAPSLNLVLGLNSYMFVVGIVLLALAAWVATRAFHGMVRTIGFCALTAVIALLHAFASALFALIVFVFEAQQWRASGRANLGRLASALSLGAVPVLTILVFDSHRSDGPINFEPHGDRIILALGGPFITYRDFWDFPIFWTILTGVLILYRNKLMEFDDRMRWTACLLAALMLVMPMNMAGVCVIHLRIPYLLAMLGIASMKVRLPDARAVSLFSFLILATLAFRAIHLFSVWQDFDFKYREFRLADGQVAMGSRIAVLTMPLEDGISAFEVFPFDNVPSFAAIDRNAFVSLMFSTNNPLRFTDNIPMTKDGRAQDVAEVNWVPTSQGFVNADVTTRDQVDWVGQYLALRNVDNNAIDWSIWPESFDYLVTLNDSDHANPVPALLDSIATGSYFTIYKIHPPR